MIIDSHASFILPYCKDVIQPRLLRRARNTSLILPAVIEKIAERKNLTPEAVQRCTTENTVYLFNLPVKARIRTNKRS